MRSFGSLVWLWVMLAVLLVNLPFLSQRILGLYALRSRIKPGWLLLLEWMFCGTLALLLGFGFESVWGQRFAQSWSFYTIALCLFMVFAFPGFVYRYFWAR